MIYKTGQPGGRTFRGLVKETKCFCFFLHFVSLFTKNNLTKSKGEYFSFSLFLYSIPMVYVRTSKMLLAGVIPIPKFCCIKMWCTKNWCQVCNKYFITNIVVSRRMWIYLPNLDLFEEKNNYFYMAEQSVQLLNEQRMMVCFKLLMVKC